MTNTSAGKRFRLALEANHPLQIVGTINAYCAMQAEKAGHQAIYLSGGGVANASYGLPDLGITSLNDVIADVERITNASQLPLLVDIDTGWGGAFNIARTITAMEKAGAVRLNAAQLDQLTQAAFTFKEGQGAGCPHAVVNKDLIGKDVSVLAQAAGLRVPDGTELLFAETDASHPFVD